MIPVTWQPARYSHICRSTSVDGDKWKFPVIFARVKHVLEQWDGFENVRETWTVHDIWKKYETSKNYTSATIISISWSGNVSNPISGGDPYREIWQFLIFDVPQIFELRRHGGMEGHGEMEGIYIHKSLRPPSFCILFLYGSLGMSSEIICPLHSRQYFNLIKGAVQVLLWIESDAQSHPSEVANRKITSPLLAV